MDDLDSEWRRKGATLSGKTAQEEFGLTREENRQGSPRGGCCIASCNSCMGNPWLRPIDGTEPRYRFPARFRKSIVLFNLHRAVACGDSVIVVEGFFDAVNVHQAGLPCVVAPMGCSLSRRQEELLQQHFREVVLLLDGDQRWPARWNGDCTRFRCEVLGGSDSGRCKSVKHELG